MKSQFVRLVRNEAGQDLIEYSLVCALIAVACIAMMQLLADPINGLLASIRDALP
jgi:Flp pilus assembly pilin Flp